MEYPETLAGLCIKAADIALDVTVDISWLPTAGMRRPDDNDVIGDERSGLEGNLRRVQIQSLIVVQLEIDRAIGAETGIRNAGGDIEGHQPVPGGDIYNARSIS